MRRKPITMQSQGELGSRRGLKNCISEYGKVRHGVVARRGDCSQPQRSFILTYNRNVDALKTYPPLPLSSNNAVRLCLLFGTESVASHSSLKTLGKPKLGPTTFMKR